ncbi:MAG: DUF6524 family protein [Pseudomonadota bacterium]
MAARSFSIVSFLLRFLFALVLVLVTYNPAEPYSFYHWALKPVLSSVETFDVTKGFVGVVLIIGWTIFLGATFRALGFFGLLLASLFFAMLTWFLIDREWLDIVNPSTVTWIILVCLSAVLATGLSWSHIWRRMTGQLDVDETDH